MGGPNLHDRSLAPVCCADSFTQHVSNRKCAGRKHERQHQIDALISFKHGAEPSLWWGQTRPLAMQAGVFVRAEPEEQVMRGCCQFLFRALSTCFSAFHQLAHTPSQTWDRPIYIFISSSWLCQFFRKYRSTMPTNDGSRPWYDSSYMSGPM